MQKFTLNQTLSQKLSPQQIQFIKLLQIPTAELDSRIEQELEVNPALEEGKDKSEDDLQDDYNDNSDNYEDSTDTLDVNDYLRDDDVSGYKMQGDGNNYNEEEREIPMIHQVGLHDHLMTQLGFLGLDDRKTIMGRQLVGSIESDGYLRRDLSAIRNDLAFTQGIECTKEELEGILASIQEFDPAGVGARDLQECLLIQIRRSEAFSEEGKAIAMAIIENHFDAFTKKHYEKIQKRLKVNDDDTYRDIILKILKLNPKPGAGSAIEHSKTQYLLPDFIVSNTNGVLDITLNARNAPDLKVSRSYSDMLDAYSKSDKTDKKLKETVSFVKQKLDAAKWFIDAIKQRQNTLLMTMRAIVEFQYDYFLEGDESKLRPMILKDIADKIQMDISTVSRVANSKSVQTEFGIYPLKYFFSEGIATDSGEDVSSREVKNFLKGLVDNEDKSKPLSDDKLVNLLKDKGYNIARRTVSKYREQLNIPVARLRKQI
ncbi:MAG: RNA polymerase factor sigma-54 [Cyclobacteriaceae bacterium]|nr:RNA polymerase factor sigma-54 [Cyclobacteriaceae bacterium]MCH8516390.1 RNA polymerase factor sigma-54 [Cyclobacteriaceae bacterium]